VEEFDSAKAELAVCDVGRSTCNADGRHGSRLIGQRLHGGSRHTGHHQHQSAQRTAGEHQSRRDRHRPVHPFCPQRGVRQLRRGDHSVGDGGGGGDQRRSKCLPEGGTIERENFGSILNRLRSALDFAHETERAQFDATAREMWHRVYPDLSEGQPGLLGAVTSRAEAQVVRLALIYALLDCSEVITEPTCLQLSRYGTTARNRQDSSSEMLLATQWLTRL